MNEESYSIHIDLTGAEQASKSVSDLRDQVEREAEKMSEVFKQRATGMESTRQQLRQMTEEIISLSMQYSALSESEKRSASGRELEAKIQGLTERASVLKDVMADVSDAIKNDASDSRVFDGLLQGLDLTISGMSSAQGVAASLGMSEEDLVAVQTKLQTALAASNFLQQAQVTLQKQSSIMRLVQLVQTQAAAKAQEMENLAKGKGVAATVALTIAQRAFNLVAKANPYVLLATALLTVVGAVVALTLANKKSTKAEEEATKAAQKHREEVQKMHEEWSNSVASSAAKQIYSYKKLQREYNALGNNLKAKEKFITDNKTAFNNLGWAVNNVSDAESLLVKNTDAVVNAIMARAEASAYENLIMQNYEKQIKERNRKDVQTGDFHKVYKSGQILTTEQVEELENQYGIKFSTVKANGFTTDRQLTTPGAEALNKAEIEDAKKRRERHKQDIIDIEKQNDELTEQLQKRLDTQKELNKKIGLTTTSDVMPEKNGGNTKDGRVENERAIAEKIEELRKTNAQRLIDADRDEMSKRISQLEYDRQRQLEELDKTHEELVKKRGGRLTPEEEAVFVEAREHVFMNESRELDAMLRDRLEKQKAAENEYLQKYGTYEEQRKAITDSFNKQIAKADPSQVKMLEKQMQEALSNLDMEKLKKSIDWEDVFSDIGNHSTKYLEDLREKLRKALDNKDITEENAKILSEKINEITDLIASKGNVWESFLPGMGQRKQLERLLKSAQEQGDEGKTKGYADQLRGMSGLTDIFSFAIGDDPTEILQGINANVQSMGELVDTLGLGETEFGEAVHNFADGTNSFVVAVQSLASGDVFGAVNGIVKGFQSWGKSIGIGNGSNGKEVARVTELNTLSNERLTQAVDRLKETMERQNGTSAVSTFQEALADQRRIIDQTMEILKAQMGYHGAHHSNAKKFNLGDDAYARISALLGRDVNSLDSLYDLTPEEMDEIRTKLTDIWASILSQGDYDKSEYWERYADLAGRIEELTEQINENLTQTSFESLRDDFVSTLMDMDSDASAFSDRFAEMMQRSLLNMVVGNTIDKELEAWYGSWAERLQSGTLTTEEIARYKSEYDALVARGLAQREQIAQLTGYESSSREAEGTKGGFRSMSQATGDELSGRFTAIQLQTARLSDIVERQAEDVARLVATGNGTYTLMGEMNDVVWRCSEYLETIARNSGYLPSMDRKLEQIRTSIDRL